ncbi:hypothetical protein [Streptomyces sp. R08]|uniref:Uncharacterized protein n=1 Tax=Streptomyces sp. R08 TaxID=3238624 RepID=A0AB39MEC3_9ACTN
MFKVVSEDAFGTAPRRTLGEFETNAEAWRFIQDTHTGRQLVVIEGGRKRAVFTWLHKGHDVYSLVKWQGPFTFDFGSWVPTGVEATGLGENRRVWTV